MSERQQRQRRARQQAVAQSQRSAARVTQPTLLSAASRAEERFQAFLRANPSVYAEFKRRALALHRRGWRHFGGKAIAESIRYETALSAATPDEPWRLNNNHISRMVRQAIADEPELAGFFELRELRSA
jgi:hypothetical protein